MSGGKRWEGAGPLRRHVPALDGIRGLAIPLVLVFHLMLFNNDAGNVWWNSIGWVRGLGFLGVDLFALSVFLITEILYDTLRDPHYFRSTFAWKPSTLRWRLPSGNGRRRIRRNVRKSSAQNCR